jgi:hypothetical protein
VKLSSKLPLLMMFVLACGVKQSQSFLAGDAKTNGDAVMFDSGIPADAAPDAKICSNGRVIFLNFEGVALILADHDATKNHIDWSNNVTIPKFHANDAGRDTLINDITRLARANLMQFPVTIVTTRPAAGPYVMVTFGGPRSLFRTSYPSVTNFNCGDVTASPVGWIADDVTAQQGANLVVSVAAIGVGLTGIIENKPRDCLCGWGGMSCVPDLTQACELSTSVMRQQACAGEPATQNEVQKMNKGFCEMR